MKWDPFLQAAACIAAPLVAIAGYVALGPGHVVAMRAVMRSPPVLAMLGGYWKAEGAVGHLPLLLLAVTGFVLVYAVGVAAASRRLGDTGTTEARRVSTGRNESLAAVVVAAVTLVFGIHGISRGFTYDELYSVRHFIGQPSVWDAASTYVMFNNHIGFSVVAHLFVSAFGGSEWVARLPALAFAEATVLATWRIGRIWLDSAAGLIGALLLAVTPSHVSFSHSARGYSAMMFLALVVTACYARVVERPSVRSTTAFVLTATAGIYVHLYFGCLVAAMAVLTAGLAAHCVARPAHGLSRAAFRHLAASFPLIGVAAAACYSPVTINLITTLRAVGPGRHDPWLPLSLLRQVPGASAGWMIAMVAGLGLLRGWGSSRRDRRPAAYVVTVTAVPVLAVWLVLRVGAEGRFFLFLLPFWMAFAGAGVAVLLGKPTRALAARLAGTAVVLALGGGLAGEAWRGDQEQPYRPASAFLASRVTAPHRPCVFGADADILLYYLPAAIVVETHADLQRLRAEGLLHGCLYHDADWNGPELVSMAADRELSASGCNQPPAADFLIVSARSVS